MKKKIPKDALRKLEIVEKIQSKEFSHLHLVMKSIFNRYKIFSPQYDPVNIVMNSTIKHQKALSILANPLAGAMANIMTNSMKHQETISKLTNSIPDVMAGIDAKMNMFKSISPESLGLNLYSANLKQYQSIVEQVSKIANGSLLNLSSIKSMINLPTFCLDTIYIKNSKLFTDSRLFGISNSLMNIQRTYSDFYKVSIDKLISEKNAELTNAILRSIELSNDQFIGSIELFNNFPYVENYEETNPEEIKLNLPIYQQEEIIKIGYTSEDEEIHSNKLCKDITRLLIQFNNCSELKSYNSEPIIKDSHKTRRALIELNTIICTDEKYLSYFISHLYTIFYESCGELKLRYLKGHGGSLEDGDCNVIWNIKHFRNHWFFHDVERDIKSKVKKKKKLLLEALSCYGFDRKPLIENEYFDLQIKIVDDLLKFVELLDQSI